MDSMEAFIASFCMVFYFVHGNVEDLQNGQIWRLEKETSYWVTNAHKALINKRSYEPNNNKAENIVFFLGDGMSASTIAATRDIGPPLSFEKFPFIGLSKTYCVDAKVPDSACTATAYLGGVKGNIYTVGLNGHVEKLDCEGSLNKSNHVISIARKFQNEGCGTGVVTTTTVTHASPSGMYAHSACRDFENDAKVAQYGFDPEKYHDIARQLVMGETGKHLKVIMGGGFGHFLPETEGGFRKDGRNLINIWKRHKVEMNKTHAVVRNKKELRKVMSQTVLPEYVLGLFSKSHMSYHSEHNSNEPSLTEMAASAVTILQKNNKRYFLMCEGGKIDMAHHENKANKAIEETREFSEAVEKIRLITSIKDTLILVTADHSHSMSFGGYINRKDPITGFAGIDSNGKAYRALTYPTGPGFRRSEDLEENEEDAENPEYEFEALHPMPIASHEGSDVMVFCSGPNEHMCSGSNEQSYYAHMMAYAACVGDGPKMNDKCGPKFCENCGSKLSSICGPKTCGNCGQKFNKI